MENELVKIFEKANKRFLKENIAFILSNVAERSLCSTLANAFIWKLDIANTPGIMLMLNTIEIMVE